VEQDRELAAYPVGDIWGVGWAKQKFLASHGITSALDLKHYPLAKAQKYLGGIVGFRLVQEMNGIPAIDKTETKDRQQIMVSRSFAGAVFLEEQIITALAAHAQEAVKRMREEHLAAKYVSVYIMTNPMSEGEQYFNSAMEKLDQPSSYLPLIQKTAERLLHQIYRNGYRYRKVMILLTGLESENIQQRDLFEDNEQREKRDRLMAAWDMINERYGRGTIRMAASETAKANLPDDAGLPFEMKRDFLSPCYTTRLEDFPRVY
jgi:DNA polymerase V